MRNIRLTLLALAALAIAGSAGGNLPPLPDVGRKVELERYAGDWYVHGSIPVGIPFFSDANAFNYSESYELLDDGSIRLTCAFKDGSFDGAERSFSFKGKVADPITFASWDVQFVWPIRASYQIIYLDDEYETSIVATPNRRYAWIMSRNTRMGDKQYNEMLKFLDAAGYKTQKIRRIPHNWPI